MDIGVGTFLARTYIPYSLVYNCYAVGGGSHETSRRHASRSTMSKQ